MTEPAGTRQSMQDDVSALALRLSGAGVLFRGPPAPPTTCCGRGCNGCVWESYDAALAFWREDALRALQEGQKGQEGQEGCGGPPTPQPPAPGA